jgi:hypothetical protein
LVVSLAKQLDHLVWKVVIQKFSHLPTKMMYALLSQPHLLPG